MFFLYNYQLSPELPPGTTKFDIVEVANEDKLVMTFLEADYSINQFMHALPNIPAAAGALNAIQNAQVIWVGTEPEPLPAMAVNSNAVVYISCDNETPYAATDGRIYTVWYGPNFESSDTRFWDRNIDATSLVDIDPQIFADAPTTLRARYYAPDQPIVLDSSRMGVIVDDDITLSFTYEHLARERRTYNTSDLNDQILASLTQNLAIGVAYPTYNSLLSDLDVPTTTMDTNAIFVVTDASGAPEIDSGLGVFFYDYSASVTAGLPQLTRIHDDSQLDVQLALVNFQNGPTVNSVPVSGDDYDALVSAGHSHDAAGLAIVADMTDNAEGNLVFNNIALDDGLPLDGDGGDTW